jgi:hypothetical protein
LALTWPRKQRAIVTKVVTCLQETSFFSLRATTVFSEHTRGQDLGGLLENSSG